MYGLSVHLFESCFYLGHSERSLCRNPTETTIWPQIATADLLGWKNHHVEKDKLRKLQGLVLPRCWRLQPRAERAAHLPEPQFKVRHINQNSVICRDVALSWSSRILERGSWQQQSPGGQQSSWRFQPLPYASVTWGLLSGFVPFLGGCWHTLICIKKKNKRTLTGKSFQKLPHKQEI